MRHAVLAAAPLGMKATPMKNIQVGCPARGGRAEGHSAAAAVGSDAFARNASPAAEGEEGKGSN